MTYSLSGHRLPVAEQVPHVQRYEREMGITRKDFFRLIPIALQTLPYRIDDRQISVSLPQGTLLIRLGAERQRKLASLTLPVIHVCFDFTNIDAEASEAFLVRFSRIYQRGGG